MAGGGPSLMDSLFQRSLEDLIKGLRLYNLPAGGITTTAGTLESTTFLSKSGDEIRREIKSTDIQTKTTALQKLTYLHSLYGIDMSWAAFHAIELSSSTIFNSKRTGYLAAAISFSASTDVILLLTHQLRKDLNSVNPHEVSLALQTLSSICTADLARDLTPELFTLLNSNKGFIKKKAIATVLRVFELYPDSVRVCFKRLVENLENADVSIVSTVVGVFCELANKEPRSYLPLAPEFYKILVDSRNNWVLIKVLKIFAKLVPLEPRLGNRVVEPICEHLKRTGAKSLAFECIRTIVCGLTQHDSAVQLAIVKIKEFLNEDDPNLKYLGLQALAAISPKSLDAVMENKEFVIKSLSDEDVNIRLEALRLVMVMMSEDNAAEICRVLINYALKSDPEFCNEILGSILRTCSRNYYEIVVDFDWYVSLLGEMARVPHCQQGEEIENQLVDIGMRVRDVRPELVRVGRELLIDPALLGNPFIHRILSAAAWVTGEYVEFCKNPFELVEALLQPRTNLLPPSVRAVYIHSAFKVVTLSAYFYFYPDEAIGASISESVHNGGFEQTSDSLSGQAITFIEPDEGFNPRMQHQSLKDDSENNGKVGHTTKDSLIGIVKLLETTLRLMASSHDVEIQDRVKNVLGLIELIQQEIDGCLVPKKEENNMGELKACEIVRAMHNAFSEELGPVSLTAQGSLPIPDGLDLKENLSDLEVICDDFRIPVSSSFSLEKPRLLEKDVVTVSDQQNEEEREMANESTSLLSEHRKRHGIYYLSSDNKEKIPDDYPLANDLSVPDKGNDEADYLVKLTEQSLVSKKKALARPRPVVVKLDDADRIHINEKLPELKEDLISGAVREVLLGDVAVASSSRTDRSERSSNRRSRRETSRPLQSNADSTTMEIAEHGNKNSNRSKQHSHGKERSHRSSGKATGESDQSGRPSSRHPHGKHKSWRRADGTMNVATQSPVVPDFLL